MNSKNNYYFSLLTAAIWILSVIGAPSVLVISPYLAHKAYADTVTWAGTAGGGDGVHWSDAANWSPHAPTGTDNIIIKGAVAVQMDIDFTLSGSGMLTIGPSDRTALDIRRTLQNSGTITNNDAGVLITGTLNNNPGGTINVNPGLENEGTINNSGTITITGQSQYVTLLNRGPINNKPGGTITINSGGTLANDDTITNEGTIDIKSGGFLQNNQFIDIKSGGNITNEGTIRNDGTITNECGGTFTNSGTYTGNPVQNQSCPDTTPPDTTIDKVTSGSRTLQEHDTISSSDSITFEFSSPDNDVASFECSLDSIQDSSFSACDSPKTYNSLTPGDHFFAVRAVDGAGNKDQSPAEFKFTVAQADNTPPTVTGTADRQPDHNGWYNHAVTITWTGDDGSGGGSGVKSCDPPTQYSGPDGSTITLTGHCTDNAGNEGTGTVTIKYDGTKPTVSSSNDGKTYLLNQPGISANADCNDATSSVDTCKPSVNTLATNTIGTHTFTITSTDNAGNTATKTISYTVGYKFNKFQSPVPNSQYNLGRVIPVKLQLFDYNNVAQSGATVKMFVKQSSWSTQQSGKSGTSSDNNIINTGNTFKYDSSTKTYIYNLSTTPKDYSPQMTKGTLTLIATAQDQVPHSGNITMK